MAPQVAAYRPVRGRVDRDVRGRARPADSYRSETLIQVVPQRVPESYVRSTVTTPNRGSARRSSSRSFSAARGSSAIIEDFDLYADERQTMVMEDVVERMRTSDIEVECRARRRFSRELRRPATRGSRRRSRSGLARCSSTRTCGTAKCWPSRRTSSSNRSSRTQGGG